MEYSFRKKTTPKTLNASSFPLTGSLRDNSLMANFLLDLLPARRFTPYLGAGLGVSWVAFDSIQGGAGTGYSGTSGQFAWQGIAGVSYALSPHWQLTGEVRYKESDRHSYPSVIGAAQNQIEFDDRERRYSDRRALFLRRGNRGHTSRCRGSGTGAGTHGTADATGARTYTCRSGEVPGVLRLR